MTTATISHLPADATDNEADLLSAISNGEPTA
jgi:hypothetical protein